VVCCRYFKVECRYFGIFPTIGRNSKKNSGHIATGSPAKVIPPCVFLYVYPHITTRAIKVRTNKNFHKSILYRRTWADRAICNYPANVNRYSEPA
jgi:hypothetical protein